MPFRNQSRVLRTAPKCSAEKYGALLRTAPSPYRGERSCTGAIGEPMGVGSSEPVGK